jgi:uncharacterized membrane protein (UPF0127 family)
MRALCFALSLAAATCQRVEEPAPVPSHTDVEKTSSPLSVDASAEPVTKTEGDAAERLEPAGSAARPAATSSTASTLETPDAGRCIEPLAEPPPPTAEPASICPHDPDEKPPVLRHGKIKLPEAKGTPVIDVEIADTPATEQRGLMYRKKLGAEQGMIFVWPNESIRTFWMHNTCLPLDMLFVAKDGTVVGLLEQVPTLNDRPRQVRCPAAYVLEVNAGWSRRHGVKPGMKLELKL